MDRDEIVSVYDTSYAQAYDDRFHGGDPWTENLSAYGTELIGELVPEGGSWLDVGCGSGKQLAAHPEIDRAGLDISPHMVERSRAENPGVTIHEGSYLDPHPEWEGRWDLVTSMWQSFQYVDSLKDMERAIANMASWVKPTGAMLFHLADVEDLARGTQIPWEDDETPVFGGSVYITSVTWTWKEPDGRTHVDLVAPQPQRMVNMLARYFEHVEIRRWPAIDPYSMLGRPKGLIARGRRERPLTAAEVGDTFPFEWTFPPRDHPLEKDPWRPGDPERTDLPGTVQLATQATVDELRARVWEVNENLTALSNALFPPPDPDRYDTLAVVHEQVWELRKDIAALHEAWARTLTSPPTATPGPDPQPVPDAAPGATNRAKALLRRFRPGRG